VNKSATWPIFRAPVMCQTRPVDVLIRLDREEPPAGTVVPLRRRESPEAGAATVLPFVGWLGMLRALAEVVNEPDRSTDG